MQLSEEQQNKDLKAKKESKSIYKGRLFNVRVDELIYEDGNKKKVEIVEHNGAAVMIPITEDGHIIFAKQYRAVIDKIILELPAGTLEKNEDPIICAQRELQEEIGYKSNNLISLGGFYPAPGFCTEYLHLFLAKDLEKTTINLDDDEAIDPVEITFEKALHLIEHGEIVDAKTIASISKYILWQKGR